MTRWMLPLLLAACATAPKPAAPTDGPPAADDGSTTKEAGAADDSKPVAEVSDGVSDSDLPVIEAIPGELPPELRPENFLPVPFSAAQLSEGFSLGTTLSFDLSGSQTPAMTVDWKVVKHTDKTVDIEFTPKPKEGERPPVNTETFAWGQLESHASFPKNLATRKEMSFTVKAGTFDVWHYEVRPPDGRSIERYYFAKRLPGPPVLHSVEVDGVEVHRMEMLTHSKI